MVIDRFILHDQMDRFRLERKQPQQMNNWSVDVTVVLSWFSAVFAAVIYPVPILDRVLVAHPIPSVIISSFSEPFNETINFRSR